MLSSTPSPPPDDREARVQALLAQLRPHAERALRAMAERLADLPEDQAFGQVEHDLRDLAHELAAASHQTGLAAGKKRAIKAPASSAPAATPTPASSATGPRPG
jgi:hypothetical protein